MSEKPDTSTLSAPLLFEGAWFYPDAWATGDREAWEAIQGRKIHESKLLDAAKAKAAAEAATPAALLAAARVEADEAQRAREAAERAAEGARAWAKAVEQMGTRCAKIDDLAEGDMIILRAWSAQESDNADRRAERLAAHMAKSAKTPEEAETLAMTARTGAYLDATLDSVVHPPRERMKYLLERYSLLRGRLYLERDKLILGVRTDQGKEPAP